MSTRSFNPEKSAHLLEPVREILGNRWKVSILQHLMNGPQMLLDLKQNIRYVSYRVLLEELADLEQLGILVRDNQSRLPMEATFSLTEKGRSLQIVFDSMLQWGCVYL